jgi:hypothetical protein
MEKREKALSNEIEQHTKRKICRLNLISSLSSAVPKLLNLPATFSGNLQIAMNIRGVNGMSSLAVLKLQ